MEKTMLSPLASHEPRPMHRYKNHYPWRVMPSEKAVAEGYFDRGFGNKIKALAYQKLIKTLFPDEPCCLCNAGRYYDAHGHIYNSKECKPVVEILPPSSTARQSFTDWQADSIVSVEMQRKYD